ncbi:hypothetical protein SAMN05421630_102387 [Prauserella marina]|uniref:Uncharacterized protein n=2 Tax=Prauserella marina TaxID=530584 RepID=A0A1G6M841_9PSEU|nr:hypothetical protein DES30_1011604 [Prauserella marina]SDC51474.1 hypothetical protein SAMN05421630_102387 [Prauserella marina]
MSAMTELEPAVLPVTVTASHLRACAEELANARNVDAADLGALLDAVVATAKGLTGTLSGLADKVGQGFEHGALSAAPSAETTALVDVLRAASTAFGCSADALAEAGPLARSVVESAGPDTRL